MDITKFLSLNLRLIKFQRFLGLLLYPLQRDRLERDCKHKKAALTTTGKLQRVEPNARGGQFYFEQAQLEICFLTPDLISVGWKGGTPPIPYAITRQEWPEVETTLEKGSDYAIVSSSAAKVIVKADGSLEFHNADGQTIREELSPQRQGETWTHQVRLRSPECIYGLGERAASLDLRRPKSQQQRIEAYRMWNSDWPGKYGSGADPLYLGIPVYLGLYQGGSYLIFYENSYPGYCASTNYHVMSVSGHKLLKVTVRKAEV